MLQSLNRKRRPFIVAPVNPGTLNPDYWWVAEGSQAPASDGLFFDTWLDDSAKAADKTGASGPQFLINIIGGMAVYRFTGSHGMIVNGADQASTTQPRTVFLVGQSNDASGSGVNAIYDATDYQLEIYLENTNIGMWVNPSGGTTDIQLLQNVPFITCAVFDSSAQLLRVNGVNATISFGIASGTGGLQDRYIGQESSGAQGSVDIAEIIEIPGVLTAPERDGVLEYLRNIYSIY